MTLATLPPPRVGAAAEPPLAYGVESTTYQVTPLSEQVPPSMRPRLVPPAQARRSMPPQYAAGDALHLNLEDAVSVDDDVLLDDEEDVGFDQAFHSAFQHDAFQHDAFQHDAFQHDAFQHDAFQHDARPSEPALLPASPASGLGSRRAPADSYVARTVDSGPGLELDVYGRPVHVRPITEVVTRRTLSALRYVVTPGTQPGELVLRALSEDEPPPFGAPIASLRPTCPSDERQMQDMLWGL